MNPTLNLGFNLPDPTASVLNTTDLVRLLQTLIFGSINGSYIPYVISATQPSVQDQDKAWLKLDSAGRPTGLMLFYNGSWRRMYNGMLGEVRMYQGDPTVDFDSTGLGKVGGNFDGWALCNGNNGTADLSDHFVAAANMNQPGNGYNSGQWQSKITGVLAQNGGNNQITLNASNTYIPPYPSPYIPTLYKMDRYDASGESNNPSGNLWGIDSVQHQVIVPPNTPNTSPAPIPSVNPFIALGFITFLGYA